MCKKYGEVKAKKNLFPKEAEKYAKSGKIGIMIIQAKASPRTKKILKEANITLYEGLEPNIVEKIREKVKENKVKENKEKENKEKEVEEC